MVTCNKKTIAKNVHRHYRGKKSKIPRPLAYHKLRPLAYHNPHHYNECLNALAKGLFTGLKGGLALKMLLAFASHSAFPLMQEMVQEKCQKVNVDRMFFNPSHPHSFYNLTFEQTTQLYGLIFIPLLDHSRKKRTLTPLVSHRISYVSLGL